MAAADRPPGVTGGPASAAGRPASLAEAVQVEDHLEPRVRLPADMLRCVTACIEIALLVGLALVATATASGVEKDLGEVSRKLATGLAGVLYFVAFIALLVLPIALAAWLIVRGQLRRLVEAAAIGLAGAGVAL